MKYLVFFVALIFGFKFGINYLTSEDFQSYGDRTKAPWTCHVTLYVGHMYLLMDQPNKAKSYFDRIPPRCGGLDVAADAAFQSVRCFDQLDQTALALQGYERFTVTYSTSARVTDAKRAISRISGAKSL